MPTNLSYRRTPEFDFNVRRGQFDGLTFEQYQALIEDKAVQLDDETAHQMQEKGWIKPAEGE